MKDFKKNKIAENRGITLMALIVTIIILLILAGISLNMLAGNNGIIGKAGKAKESSEISEEKEIIEKAIVQAMGINKYGNLIQSELQSNLDDNKAKVYENGDEFIVLFNSNRMYTIDNEGNIQDTITNYEVATKKFNDELTNANLGTEEKPYEINCIEDLVDLSYKVNGISVDETGTLTYTSTRNTFGGKYIILTKNLNFKLPLSYENSSRKDYGDINGNGTVEELLTELTTGTGWIPIGGNDHGDFRGNFNGKNYSIGNLYINNENIMAQSGLFGILFGSIENLGVSGNIFCKSNCAGGICGSGRKIIKNCYFNGNIENINTSGWGTGGIVGVSYTIETTNCHCSGKVIGCHNYVGGIIGQNDGKTIDCYNESHVIGKNVNGIGGIVGHHREGDIVSNCYNTGKVEGSNYIGGIVGYRYKNIENCYNTGEIVGNNYVGGIGGYGDWRNNLSITQCYNTGKIKGNDCVGGVLGSNCSTYVLTTNECFNTGEVTGNNSSCGIVGTLNSSASSVINSYNRGKIKGNNAYGIAFGTSDNLKLISCYNIGELNSSSTNKYGICSKGVTENCYYLTNRGVSTEKATEVTSEQLKGLAKTLDKTYIIDDENNTITINENTSQNVWKNDTDNKNQGYPIFNWQ